MRNGKQAQKQANPARAVNLTDTGERMVPEFHKGHLLYAEHVTRYLCAQKMVSGKVVLDIASGSGYGTHMLAKTAAKVYGVDINENAVAYARKHFGGKNIEYRVGDGVSVPLDDNSVDVVVTFETIEHIPDYKAFLREVQRVLKPNGIALVSTPNDVEFAEGNHFHVHEFEYDELHRLLKNDFKYTDPYFQATWKYVAIGDHKTLSHEGDFELPTFNMSPLKPEQYLYFFFVCSNSPLKEHIEPIAALGGHYSDRTILGEKSADNQIIADLSAQIEELKGQVMECDEEKQKVHDHLETVSRDLHNIATSRSYRLAQRLARAKHMFKKESA